MDALLKALGNHEIANKVRELDPVDLDKAVKHARRLESYARCDVAIPTGDQRRYRKKNENVRTVNSTPKHQGQSNPGAQQNMASAVPSVIQRSEVDYQNMSQELNELREVQRRGMMAPPPLPSLVPGGGTSG